jgi:hypothetical protein
MRCDLSCGAQTALMACSEPTAARFGHHTYPYSVSDREHLEKEIIWICKKIRRKANYLRSHVNFLRKKTIETFIAKRACLKA